MPSVIIGTFIGAYLYIYLQVVVILIIVTMLFILLSLQSIIKAKEAYDKDLVLRKSIILNN